MVRARCFTGCRKRVVGQCSGFNAACGRYYCRSHTGDHLCLICYRSQQQSPSCVMSRRKAVKVIGSSLLYLTSLVSGVITVGTFLEDSSATKQAKRAADKDAEELFRQLFGYIDGAPTPGTPTDRLFSVVAGRQKYPTKSGFHGDNYLTSAVLREPLGLPNEGQQPENVNRAISPDWRGDLFVIGGPNSTKETMIAWEFEGSDDQHLTRPEERGDQPIIPLRWYGVSDATRAVQLGAPRVAYKIPESGARVTLGWPFVEVRDGRIVRPWVPRPSPEALHISDQRYPVPDNNYLCITRMPNILSPQFPQALAEQRLQDVPYLLVIDGSNGIGTRASELLTDSRGLPILEEAATRLGGSTEFQLLFEVGAVSTTDDPRYGEFDSFTELRSLIGAYRFEEVGDVDWRREMYLRAHARAASWRSRDVPWIASSD